MSGVQSQRGRRTGLFRFVFRSPYVSHYVTGITSVSRKREKLVRTTITLPSSLKEEMSRTDENWSEVIRELLTRRLEEEGEADMAEAVILTERVRRPARGEWNSLRVIKEWRRRTTS